ncbi:hypothetical protein Cadr_000012260 [Camelus dromedarius]|uniref:Uncharacterized protein n=1 Tax=Camelus dromedarius TaxID=9838 RepID=A0A5N4DUM6_CAMDR|nr:hypothetical protein Cadr_000012260 [Camelus dromedarius]
MSGAGPRTARASRKGVWRARPGGPAPWGRAGGRASASAGAGAGGGRAPRARGPKPPLPLLPSPARAPRLSGTSFACRLAASVRARGRGAGAWEGGGEGALPLGGARAGLPRPSEGTPGGPSLLSLLPLLVPVGPAPAGNKGDALGPRDRSLPTGKPRLRTRRPRWSRAGNYPTNTS